MRRPTEAVTKGRGAGRRDKATRPSKADSTTTEDGSGCTRTPARSFPHRGVATGLCHLRQRCRRCRRSAPLDTLGAAYRAPKWRGGTGGSMARVQLAGIPPPSSATAPASASPPGCGDGAGGASRPSPWPTRAATWSDSAPRASCLNTSGCVGGGGAPPWCSDTRWIPPALTTRWPHATQVRVPTAGRGGAAEVFHDGHHTWSKLPHGADGRHCNSPLRHCSVATSQTGGGSRSHSQGPVIRRRANLTTFQGSDGHHWRMSQGGGRTAGMEGGGARRRHSPRNNAQTAESCQQTDGIGTTVPAGARSPCRKLISSPCHLARSARSQGRPAQVDPS